MALKLKVPKFADWAAARAYGEACIVRVGSTLDDAPLYTALLADGGMPFQVTTILEDPMYELNSRSPDPFGVASTVNLFVRRITSQYGMDRIAAAPEKLYVMSAEMPSSHVAVWARGFEQAQQQAERAATLRRLSYRAKLEGRIGGI